MRFLYSLSIQVLAGGIRIAAFFHPKARLWHTGRLDWRARYRNMFSKKGRVLWVHAASLGEFEQGRPVIEAFRLAYPDWQIVLSFFSPSGYEIRKNYAQADWVCYLPADTPGNARDFLDLIRPDAAVFVKYEFWANYLFELKNRSCPTLLVSALFRPGQPFFRWYGAFWRRMLTCFSHIFVQNAASARLLQSRGFQQLSVAGDTRVDRVLKLAQEAPENPIVQAFAGDSPVFIAGSSWEADEAVLLPVLQNPEFKAFKLIIAPHEPSEKHLTSLLAQLTRPYLRYSQCLPSEQETEAAEQTRLQRIAGQEILIIDNVGMLNTLYRYGAIAWIGGGFGKGIHNTLEPAAFGLPVLFGPRYEKFEEARQLVARGGAFALRDARELGVLLKKLRAPEAHAKASAAVRDYLEESRGATEQVIRYFAAHFFP